MDYTEKKLRRLNTYEGIIVNVGLDRVRLPDGSEAFREIVEHPGGACILPVDGEGNAYCVRQYRYPVQRVTLEIPAGKLDAPDEDPYVCAVRELSEETGYTAKTIEKLTTIGTTVGFSNEYIHIYKAEGLTPGEMHPDDDEFLNVVRVPLAEAVQMTRDGRIFDAKSIVAILMLQEDLRS